MRKLLTTVLLGWVFYSLGYTDPHGRFVLSVQASRSEEKGACERLRAYAAEEGWFVLPACVPDGEGPQTTDAERTGGR